MDNVMLQQALNNSLASSCQINSGDQSNFTCAELQEYVTTQLNKMRFNHFLTDMILYCEDQEFEVHSSIMAASSGFFQELISANGQTSTIQLPNVKASAISSLLTYIYTGNMELLQTVADLRNILTAARWLQVNDFMVHVSALIPNLLTTENYLDVWDVADEFENCAVAEEVESFVTANYVKICSNPPFLMLSPTRMQRVCKNSHFRTIPTHIVLKSIIRWVDHDKNVRRNYISALLIYVHENFIDDVRDVGENVRSPTQQKVNISMTCNTSPPRTSLSPPQRDTTLDLKPTDVPASENAEKNSYQEIPLKQKQTQSSISIDLLQKRTLNSPNTLSPTLNVEIPIWNSPTISKEQLFQMAISDLDKSPKTAISEYLSSPTGSNLKLSVEDTTTCSTTIPLKAQHPNSNLTIQDDSTATSLGDNAMIRQESCHPLESDATTTSPPVLASSDSLALSLSFENCDKRSNNDYGLVKYSKHTNSQNSCLHKERVPRLHLTAVSNDNCHLKRFASRCKIIVNSAKRDKSPNRHDIKVCNSTSMSTAATSTPESLSWPCVCPMLQKSDMTILEAVTALSERSSFSPEETEAIMLFNQALTDKLNCIPERETTCLQSMISVPIPVYHPMFYLNRNALEKSAFKPVKKNNRVVRTARKDVASRDTTEVTRSARSESKAAKKHQKSSGHQSTSRRHETKVTTDHPNKIKMFVPENLSNTKQSEDNMSEVSCTSSRETLSGLYNFNQQLNLRYWSRNFDGSPLTEPVVVILGQQKHGSLMMLNFNLDTHAWRKSEEVDTVLKKHNLELLRNGVSLVNKNQVYIIGGEDRHGTPKSSVLILQLREIFHPSLTTPLLIPRSGSGGTIFQEFIYIVGGITVGGKILNQAERYSLDTKKWNEIEPLPVYGWAMSLAELGKKLISVGGRKSGECMIGCYSYDPEANQWTQLLGMPKEFECPYALVTLYGNQVLAFRRTNMNLQGSVAWLDPIRYAWNSLEISGTPCKRILSAVRHRHKVWILDQSSRLYVYDHLTHTWENAFSFQRSISIPLYAFIVYRALPNQNETE